VRKKEDAMLGAAGKDLLLFSVSLEKEAATFCHFLPLSSNRILHFCGPSGNYKERLLPVFFQED
jgi:hypothetical protein